MSLSFTEKWKQAIRRNNSLVCVGLDTDPAQLPACRPRQSRFRPLLQPANHRRYLRPRLLLQAQLRFLQCPRRGRFYHAQTHP